MKMKLAKFRVEIFAFSKLPDESFCLLSNMKEAAPRTKRHRIKCQKNNFV